MDSILGGKLKKFKKFKGELGKVKFNFECCWGDNIE